RCYVLRCLRPHRDLHPFPTRRSSDLFAIVDLDGVQSVVPWDDVELQPVSGMETDNPEFGLVWSAGATEPMTMTLDISALGDDSRSEEHTSELQSRENLVCRLLLEKKK